MDTTFHDNSYQVTMLQVIFYSPIMIDVILLSFSTAVHDNLKFCLYVLAIVLLLCLGMHDECQYCIMTECHEVATEAVPWPAEIPTTGKECSLTCIHVTLPPLPPRVLL